MTASTTATNTKARRKIRERLNKKKKGDKKEKKKKNRSTRTTTVAVASTNRRQQRHVEEETGSVLASLDVSMMSIDCSQNADEGINASHVQEEEDEDNERSHDNLESEGESIDILGRSGAWATSRSVMEVSPSPAVEASRTTALAQERTSMDIDEGATDMLASAAVIKSPVSKILSKRQRKQFSPPAAQIRKVFSAAAAAVPSSTLANWGSPSPRPKPSKRRDKKKTPVNKLDQDFVAESVMNSPDNTAMSRSRRRSSSAAAADADAVMKFSSPIKSPLVVRSPNAAAPITNSGGDKIAGSRVLSISKAREIETNAVATRLFHDARDVAIDNVLARSSKQRDSASNDGTTNKAGSFGIGPGSLVMDMETASSPPSILIPDAKGNEQQLKEWGAEQKQQEKNGGASKMNVKAKVEQKSTGPQPSRRSTRRQVPTDRLSVTWESDRYEETASSSISDGTITSANKGKNKKITYKSRVKKKNESGNKSRSPNIEAKPTTTSRPRRQGKEVDRLSVTWSNDGATESENDFPHSSAGDNDDIFAEYEQMCKDKKKAKKEPDRPAKGKSRRRASLKKGGKSTSTKADVDKDGRVKSDSSANTGKSPSLLWTIDQVQALRKAHHSVNPTSCSFWEDVAARLDGKTPEQCREKWFSLVQTPKVRAKKKRVKDDGQGTQGLPCEKAYSNMNEDDDDLFNSTPFRRANVRIDDGAEDGDNDDDNDSTAGIGHVGGDDVMLPCDFDSPISHSPAKKRNPSDDDDNNDANGNPFEASPIHFRTGYKGYIKGLAKIRRNVGKRRGGRGGGPITSPTVKGMSGRAVSAKVGAGDVQMNGVMSPGGTVQVRAPTDSDLEDLVIRPGQEFSDDEHSIEKENAELEVME